MKQLRARGAWAGVTGLLLAALLLGGCARGRTPSTGVSGSGDVTGSLVVGGVTRTYYLHLPPASSRGAALPLVISLHGGGGTGAGMARLTGMNAVADANDFLAAYPDGLDHHWNDGRDIANVTSDDLGFFSALIATLVARYHADPARVYVTGISNGGMMTQRVGCELADKVAAIAPVAGLMPIPESARCHPGRPVPVIEFQGTADPLIPVGGGVPRCDPGFTDCGMVLSAASTMADWAARNGCASTFTTQLLPDLDHSDGPAPSHDSTVSVESYTGCPAGGAVELYLVSGGGHTWPGGEQYLPALLVGWTNRDVNASQVIWRFFASQRLPAGH